MTIETLKILLLAGSVIALGACNKTVASDGNNTATAETKTSSAADSSDPVASAESAAPSAIAHNAAVVTVDAKGAVTTVRKGSNGWTCMPDAPDTPGVDPMCYDANAGKWVEAWVAHKPPPAGNVGLMYMLEGGTDAATPIPMRPSRPPTMTGSKPVRTSWSSGRRKSLRDIRRARSLILQSPT